MEGTIKQEKKTIIGNISTVPVVDATLTYSGYAADAKVVGDRLNKVSPEYAHNVIYDNASSGLSATDVQGAIDKISAKAADMEVETNRPRGSYIGDGSTTERKIEIPSRSGWLGVCSGSYKIGFISSNGAVFFNTTNSTTKCFPVAQASYMNGVLKIASNDTFLNENGTTYHYQAL